jgi:pimeloyl-ACP methyl ester carboxylesterase
MKRIVALHGAGMNGEVWNKLSGLDALTFPGHEAEGGALPSIGDMASWVEKEISPAPEKSVVLMGHSMGALVAMASASAPQVAGLVLVGAAAEMPVNADLLKTAFENPAEAAALVRKWSVFSKNPAAEDIRAELAALMGRVPSDAIGIDLQACDDFKESANLARSISVPTLVISGDSDKMAPVDKGRALAAFIPGGVFEQISECGHMPMLEKSGELQALIQRFLDRALTV